MSEVKNADEQQLKLLDYVWSIVSDVYRFSKYDNKHTVVLKINLYKDAIYRNNSKEIMTYLENFGFSLHEKIVDNKVYLEIKWAENNSLKHDLKYTNIKDLYRKTLKDQIRKEISPLTFQENLENHYLVKLDLGNLNAHEVFENIQNEQSIFEQYIRDDVVKSIKNVNVNIGNVFLKLIYDKDIYVKIDVFPFTKSVRLMTQELQRQESLLDKIKRALSLK